MPRLFGTNGIRGIANQGMTGEFALKMGMAIGSYFQGGTYIVGTDTRTSNQLLKNAVMAGVLSVGGFVLDVGIAPSPAVQYAVPYRKAQAGVMITASHNPPEFNGIKVIDSDGTELGREKEEGIEDIFFCEDFCYVPWDQIRGVQVWDARGVYRDAVVSRVQRDILKRKRYQVVLDCGNGAGTVVVPLILQDLGCRVDALNCEPDGLFPGRLPEPTREHLGELMDRVKDTGADVGVALDGDADRAVFVDETGGYVPGEKTLALLARYLVPEGGICVTPVSTSSCVADVVEEKRGKVVYTRVGAPIVARRMIEVRAAFGGEENGGLIFPYHQYCRDGGMASAAILDLLATTGKPLSQLVQEIPPYILYKGKVSCPDTEKDRVMNALRDRCQGKVDVTDGVKIFLPEGWVLVRPSGTEPLIRVFAEAREKDTAEKMAREYMGVLESFLGTGGQRGST